MGDAVLAFFPGYDAAHSCGAALASARAILDEIDHFQYEGLGVKA